MQQEKVQRWHSNDNFILRTVGGENVLVQIGDSPDPRLDNCMISLNETSAFLWNFFAEGDHSEEETLLSELAGKTVTHVLALWDDASLDLPSIDFRQALMAQCPGSQSTLILLQTGSGQLSLPLSAF